MKKFWLWFLLIKTTSFVVAMDGIDHEGIIAIKNALMHVTRSMPLVKVIGKLYGTEPYDTQFKVHGFDASVAAIIAARIIVSKSGYGLDSIVAIHRLDPAERYYFIDATSVDLLFIGTRGLIAGEILLPVLGCLFESYGSIAGRTIKSPLLNGGKVVTIDNVINSYLVAELSLKLKHLSSEEFDVCSNLASDISNTSDEVREIFSPSSFGRNSTFMKRFRFSSVANGAHRPSYKNRLLLAVSHDDYSDKESLTSSKSENPVQVLETSSNLVQAFIASSEERLLSVYSQSFDSGSVHMPKPPSEVGKKQFLRRK